MAYTVSGRLSRNAAGVLLGLLVAVEAGAQAQKITVDTVNATTAATIGTTSLGAGSLRVAGLAGASADSTLVSVETDGDVVKATGVSLTDGGGGTLNLGLAPSGDVTLDPTGNDVLPGINYDINLGMLSKKYLTLHAAELWVETLVAQETLATIGGRILVGPTTTLTSDLAAAGATIYTKHNNLANGDRVLLEANGKFEVIGIASAYSGTGPYSYSVNRNLDGTGANDWYAGDAVFNTGTTGNGFIDLYSVRGVKAASEVGPTIVGNVRLSSTWNDWAPRWAIGNLNGVYGYSATTYGAAFGDPSDVNVTIDATDGIRLRENGTTVRGQWKTNGDVVIGESTKSRVQISGGWMTFWNDANTQVLKLQNDGTVTVCNDCTSGTWNGVAITTSGLGIYSNGAPVISFNTSGEAFVEKTLTVGTTSPVSGQAIRSGTTTWSSGTGFWFGYDSSAYKLRVGNASTGNRLKWDGSALELASRYLTINESGVVINSTTGIATDRMFRFDGCSGVPGMAYDEGDDELNLVSTCGFVSIDVAGSKWFTFTNNAVLSANANLGSATYYFGETYINPTTTTSAFYPLVIDGYQVKQKTNGINGTTDYIVSSGKVTICFHYGIAVPCA